MPFLSLLFYDLWVFVKENPDKKKSKPCFANVSIFAGTV